MEISNNWRNKISIRDQFEDETTPELIIQLSTSLIKQLNKVKVKEENSNLSDLEKYHVVEQLEAIVDNFEFLKKLADGTIPEDEWNKYSFDGDFQTEFNGYFNELYDLGDERVLNKNGVQEKFMWIY